MNDKFEWSRLVEFYETDLAGITHFSNFYRWMESAEHDFLRVRGVGAPSRRNWLAPRQCERRF